MKKIHFGSLLIGIIAGALVFGGSLAVSAGVTAEPSAWKIFVDGKPAGFEAYSIAGSNWLKLRNVCNAVDTGVWFDADKKAVYIERDKGYDANYTGPAAASTPEPAATPQSAESVHIKLAKAAYQVLPNHVKFPSTLVIHSAQGGYGIPDGGTQAVVLFEYSAENNLGDMVRGYLCAYYKFDATIAVKYYNAIPSDFYGLFPIDMAEII